MMEIEQVLDVLAWAFLAFFGVTFFYTMVEDRDGGGALLGLVVTIAVVLRILVALGRIC